MHNGTPVSPDVSVIAPKTEGEEDVSHLNVVAPSPAGPSVGRSSLGSRSRSPTRRRQRLIDEILRLQKCLPTSSELLRIANAASEETIRVHEFGLRVKLRIQQLDAERKQLDAEETTKREEARMRAKEHHVRKHSRRVEEFMKKVLSHEDRLVEIERERQQAREQKAILEEINRLDLITANKLAEEEKQRKLAEKKRAWSRAVSAVEQRRHEFQVEQEERIHGGSVHTEGLSWFEHQRRLRVQKERELEALNELEQRRDAHEMHHREMAKQALEAKREQARKIAYELQHPDAPAKKQEEIRRQLEQAEERARRQLRASQQEKDRKLAEAAQKRAEKEAFAAHAQEQLTQQLRTKQQEMERRIAERMMAHGRRVEEKVQQYKLSRVDTFETRLKQCKSTLEKREQQGHSKLAARLLERTLRVGHHLGVDESIPLPPPPKLKMMSPPPPPLRTKPLAADDANATGANDSEKGADHSARRGVPRRGDQSST